MACIISTAVTIRTEHNRSVALLYNREKHAFAVELYELLTNHGVVTEWVQLGTRPKSYQTDVISTLDLDGPFLYDISEQNHRNIMSFISKLQASMLRLTRPAQIRCTDPRYGLVIGFGHTVRKELGIDFSNVQLENLDSFGATAVKKILDTFQDRPQNIKHLSEPDLVVFNNEVYVPRYHWLTHNDELQISENHETTKQLILGSAGGLDSLYWAEKEPASLQDGDVEVQVHYVGLNARVRVAKPSYNLFQLHTSSFRIGHVRSFRISSWPRTTNRIRSYGRGNPCR